MASIWAVTVMDAVQYCCAFVGPNSTNVCALLREKGSLLSAQNHYRL